MIPGYYYQDRFHGLTRYNPALVFLVDQHNVQSRILPQKYSTQMHTVSLSLSVHCYAQSQRFFAFCFAVSFAGLPGIESSVRIV